MNLPILDTEEKLREYLNKVAGCEVDPLTIKAHIFPDRVHLDTNHDPGMHIALAQSSPRWFQIQSYGMVDRAVIPVLKELHARLDKEIQEALQKRREESCRRETERNYTGSLEQMARKANMTHERFMGVKQALEKKTQAPRSDRAALPPHPNLQPLQMKPRESLLTILILIAEFLLIMGILHATKP